MVKRAVKAVKAKTKVSAAKPATRRLTKKPVDTSSVKELDPRHPDTSKLGDEPLFLSQPEDHRIGHLVRAFNWYNHFYDKQTVKDLLLQYLELNSRSDEAKIIRQVEKSDFINPISWLARLSFRGLVLSENELASIENEIMRLVNIIKKPTEKAISVTGGSKKEAVKEPSNRPNVQELMKEKTREAAGEIEGLFDDFIISGAKVLTANKVMDEMRKKNILPQHVHIIANIWKKRRTELEEVTKGKDTQLVQAYSHWSKIQVRNMLKFVDQVEADLNSYISVKKAAKAPRARKAVPVEKVVAKLKFCKEFKDQATKLDLTGLHPVKLHGCAEAWVYDTAKRKMHHYIADEHSKTLSVKGNTLLGFDTRLSEVKTLRKPAEQIKEIMGSKPAARKFFKDIKAVSTAPNGRFSLTMLILKAF